MPILQRSAATVIAMFQTLPLAFLSAQPSRAQAPATPAAPTIAYAAPSISLTEARAIIDGATAFAREANLRMAVVVVDQAGNVVSSDRMDGAALQNIRFAEGKAFASALYRQTTEDMGALYKSRPDRDFGIMNMYPGKILSCRRRRAARGGRKAGRRRWCCRVA